MSIRNLFLVDGTGALITAIMLSVVLPHFGLLVGIDPDMITVMLLIALLLSILSWTFYFTFNQKSYKMFQVVGISNLLYTFVLGVVLVVYSKDMENLTIGYFILEALIIAVLGSYELIKYKKVSSYLG